MTKKNWWAGMTKKEFIKQIARCQECGNIDISYVPIKGIICGGCGDLMRVKSKCSCGSENTSMKYEYNH